MIHSFAPIYDSHTKLLVLGSMPSVRSLQASFYYMHPRNRFWWVMEQILERPIPPAPADRTALLLACGVGLWDVLASCQRNGSLDSAIVNPRPNPIDRLPHIQTIPIFTNGAAADRFFHRFFPTLCATRLPSTSPANAAHFSLTPWLALRSYLS